MEITPFFKLQSRVESYSSVESGELQLPVSMYLAMAYITTRAEPLRNVTLSCLLPNTYKCTHTMVSLQTTHSTQYAIMRQTSLTKLCEFVHK